MRAVTAPARIAAIVLTAGGGALRGADWIELTAPKFTIVSDASDPGADVGVGMLGIPARDGSVRASPIPVGG